MSIKWYLSLFKKWYLSLFYLKNGICPYLKDEARCPPVTETVVMSFSLISPDKDLSSERLKLARSEGRFIFSRIIVK